MEFFNQAVYTNRTILMTASRNKRKRTKTHSDITIRFSQSV